MERNNPTGILDPRSKLAVFVTACFSVFSGLSYIQEISLLALCVFTTLLCKKWKRAFYTGVLFLAMLLSDLYMVPHLTGVSRNIMTAICPVLRFILPLFASFYLITKTTKIGEYISALTKIHMPSEVVIPLAVMFRFVPTYYQIMTSFHFRHQIPWYFRTTFLLVYLLKIAFLGLHPIAYLHSHIRVSNRGNQTPSSE